MDITGSHPPKAVHLICHAHIDPAWLWQWEEGLTATLSTFRTACDFCERVGGLVFCHNESLLYEWTETHDPELFGRIRRLVAGGQWHIAGGSYVQPDVNLPSGESHIRQFLIANRYFRRAFGTRPTTAYNFDSFGHAEGYVQILRGCGFDSYIFCRPNHETLELPMHPFRWRDRSGKEVLARRCPESYPTNGKAGQKLAEWIPRYASEPVTIFLWGIGNHGGGPNWEDLRQIREYQENHPELQFIHSTPEAYFRDVRAKGRDTVVIEGEFQNWCPGCYVSMSRVKRAHRMCEGLVAVTERMAAMAWWLGASPYPAGDLEAAWKDLLFSEFHDILPGTATQSVEQDALGLLGHCAEILRRMRARIFLALLRNEPPARENATPIFVWNPHSFPVRQDVECEVHYANNVPANGDVGLDVRDAVTGKRLAFQRESAETPLATNQRTKVVLPLDLAPYQMRRIEVSPGKSAGPRPAQHMDGPISRYLTMANRFIAVRINRRTGLLDFAGRGGEPFLKREALRPIIFGDTSNAWVCGRPVPVKAARGNWFDMRPWGPPRTAFRLATPEEAKRILAPPSRLASRQVGAGTFAPIRVVEHGCVRTIVEAVFVADESAIIRRYILSHRQRYLEVRDRIFWNQKDSILKIALPLAFNARETIAETPYSAISRTVPTGHIERCNQRWVAAVGSQTRSDERRCVAVLSDCSYAHSLHNNTLYVSILRSPIYSAASMKVDVQAHRDRYWPRQDQGEHQVTYRILFETRFDEVRISRLAQVMNIPPTCLSHNPPGEPGGLHLSENAMPFVTVSPGHVQVACLKKAEDREALVVRLWQQRGRRTRVTLRIAGGSNPLRTTIPPYGLKTLLVRRKGSRLIAAEANLIEDELKERPPSRR